MVSILALWLPILVSAILVFVVSSIIHMVLPYHRGDFKKVPDEDGVMDAMRKFSIPPGEYIFPHAGSMKGMSDPAFVAKIERGPVAFLTVMRPGPPTMAGNLVLWFLYSVLVGAMAAYIAGRALPPGAPYLAAFRFAGATAFAAYALALIQNSIWDKRAWSTTLKFLFDGLVYALLTGGAFGWLWPR
jgi:hypothetical protein